MMKKIGRTKYGITLPLMFVMVCLCAALVLGFALSAQKTVRAECGSEELTAFLESEHFVGETIALPKAQIKEGNETYETDVALIAPDGRMYAGNSVTLTDFGSYTLLYTAKNGETDSQYKEPFTVKQYLYTASGEQTEIGFGAVSSLTEYPAEGRSGMVVDIAENETVYANTVIDLSDYTAEDDLFRVSFLPHTLGTADAQFVYITFTDVHDSSNTLTVELRYSPDGNTTETCRVFAMFYASGQGKQGLEYMPAGNGDFTYDGKSYKRHQNDGYGGKAAASMQGYNPLTITINAEDVGTTDIICRFDYETKRFYYGENIQQGVNLANDLDDPNLQSTLWQGFTTGECYVSVSAGSYSQSHCRMLFTHLAGMSLAENGTVADTEAPVITVDDSDLAAADYAVIGKPFAVPSATALDSYAGECPVAVRVYTSYGTSTQALVAVENGSFTPIQAREYTIVYTAEDYSGNIAEKTYTFEAKERTPETDMKVSYTKPSSLAVGQEMDFGTFAADNANGNWYLTLRVSFGDESETVAEISAENATDKVMYRPMASGMYTFTLEYRDYTNEYTDEFDVEVSADGDPILLVEPQLPRYIIKGAQYTLSELCGYTFENGTAQVTPATLYVTETKEYSGASPITGNLVTVSEDWTECWFTYVLGDTVKQYRVPVQDVGYGASGVNIYKYFTGFSDAAVEQAQVSYTVAEQGGLYSLDFINALMMYDFGLTFTVPADAEYDSITITLTDKEDPSVVLTTVLSAQSDGSIVMKSNGARNVFTTKFYGSTISFAYSDESLGTSIDGGANYYSVGDGWEGFPSMRAWLSISFNGVTGTPKITISRVNNQTIGYIMPNGTAQDVTAPQFNTPVSEGYQKIGSEYALAPFYAADVLDPDITVSMSVTLNGKYITSVDGTVLQNVSDVEREYTIRLSDYGAYAISYVVSDSVGNRSTYLYAINVVDTDSPAVAFGSHAGEANVNESINIAEITVTDNVSAAENCTVRIYVCSPQNVFTELEGESFVPETAGTYSVWYFVTDEAGNCTFAHYDIVVS